jgi:hypothetical protein
VKQLTSIRQYQTRSTKSEIRNKSEVRNTKQIQYSKQSELSGISTPEGRTPFRAIAFECQCWRAGQQSFQTEGEAESPVDGASPVDLSPCIVFIEDIDLIGQARQEFGYQRGNALLSLLAVLDGIEEKSEIVTVATTNCLYMFDKALSQRPSRFDRVIKLSRPKMPQRRELMGRLCRKIPLDEETQAHTASHSEGCTPAQLQEIVHSLVIKRLGASEIEPPDQTFAREALKQLMARINSGRQPRVGFVLPDYRAAGTTDNVNQEERRWPM